MPRLTDRRRNKAQRRAVERVISTSAGITSVIAKGDDGSVFVYEEHSDWIPPTTLRTRITAAGEIGKPQRFHRSVFA